MNKELSGQMVEMLKAWIKHKGFQVGDVVTLTGWKKHFLDHELRLEPAVAATVLGKIYLRSVRSGDPRVSFLAAKNDTNGKNHALYTLARTLGNDE